MRRVLSYTLVSLVLCFSESMLQSAIACPFCSAVSLTFAQEMKAADAVVIAELVELPKRPAGADGPFAPGISEAIAKSKFRIVEVLKGGEYLKKAKEIDAVFFGDSPVGT